MADQKPPKVFISYRWSSPEHEDWVMSFATSLRNDGIEAILDKWHLREGQDTLVFMETMVSDPEVVKVLLICDEPYVDRANKRSGGVGTEAQIVSSKIYDSTSQDKFAAIVRDLDADGKPFLPNYMKTRLYFDMSSQDTEVSNYEKVVRWVFGKPFHVAPEIGNPPKFLDDTYGMSRSIQIESQNFKRNIRNNPDSGLVSAAALLSASLLEVEGLAPNLSGKENPDDIIYSEILQTQPLREEIYKAFRELCRSKGDSSADVVHAFLESLIPLMDRSPMNVTYTRIDNDVIRYTAHDVLVSFVALALSERNYLIAAKVLSMPFFKKQRDRATGEITNYSEFWPNIQALDIRNSRLNLRRLSLHADVLSDLHKNSIVDFESFMEADFLLYVRSLLGSGLSWYPVSALYLVYGHGALPVFARAQSSSFYERIRPLLLNMKIDDFKRNILPHVSDNNGLRFDYRTLNLSKLMNFEGLATVV